MAANLGTWAGLVGSGIVVWGIFKYINNRTKKEVKVYAREKIKSPEEERSSEEGGFSGRGIPGRTAITDEKKHGFGTDAREPGAETKRSIKKRKLLPTKSSNITRENSKRRRKKKRINVRRGI